MQQTLNQGSQTHIDFGPHEIRNRVLGAADKRKKMVQLNIIFYHMSKCLFIIKILIFFLRFAEGAFKTPAQSTICMTQLYFLARVKKFEVIYCLINLNLK
jgi:hypothetical protein